VPRSDKKNNFIQEQKELTKRQKDGIEKKLSNNPIVQFVGIKLLEVIPGRSNLVFSLFRPTGSSEGSYSHY